MYAALASLLLYAVTPGEAGERTYYGMYTGKFKIGYSWNDSKVAVKLDGKPAIRWDSGTSTTMLVDGRKDTITNQFSEWTTKDGVWLREVEKKTSNGNEAVFTATVGKSAVQWVARGNGHTIRRTIPIPVGRISLDLESMLTKHEAQLLAGVEYWIFDCVEARFVKASVKESGHRRLSVFGREQDTTVLDYLQDGVSSRSYVDRLGKTIRGEATLRSVEAIETKAHAMSFPGPTMATTDLRLLASVAPDKPIEDPFTLRGLKIRVVGEGFSGLPSDGGQTVIRDGNGWIIDIHPKQLAASPSISRETAAASQKKWMKVSDEFTEAERQKMKLKFAYAGKSAKETISAVLHMWAYEVFKPGQPPSILDENQFQTMSPPMDYLLADSCANVIRMAGVPARVVAGYVAFRDRFMQHNWIEAWDGESWVGIDMTAGRLPQLSANHLELTTGDMTHPGPLFFDPDRVKINVLETRR